MFGGGDELRGGIIGGKVTSSREINHKKQAATKCASIEVFTRASHSGIHRDSRERWHPDVSSTNKNMIVLCIYKNVEIEDRKNIK